MYNKKNSRVIFYHLLLNSMNFSSLSFRMPTKDFRYTRNITCTKAKYNREIFFGIAFERDVAQWILVIQNPLRWQIVDYNRFSKFGRLVVQLHECQKDNAFLSEKFKVGIKSVILKSFIPNHTNGIFALMST